MKKLKILILIFFVKFFLWKKLSGFPSKTLPFELIFSKNRFFSLSASLSKWLLANLFFLFDEFKFSEKKMRRRYIDWWVILQPIEIQWIFTKNDFERKWLWKYKNILWRKCFNIPKLSDQVSRLGFGPGPEIHGWIGVARSKVWTPNFDGPRIPSKWPWS